MGQLMVQVSIGLVKLQHLVNISFYLFAHFYERFLTTLLVGRETNSGKCR
jgi:hypothetical protein